MFIARTLFKVAFLYPRGESNPQFTASKTAVSTSSTTRAILEIERCSHYGLIYCYYATAITPSTRLLIKLVVYWFTAPTCLLLKRLK